MGNSAMDLVLSQQIPVDPDGEQPPYYRSKRSIQTSSDLIEFQQCVAAEMDNKSFSDRQSVRDGLTEAANTCEQ